MQPYCYILLQLKGTCGAFNRSKKFRASPVSSNQHSPHCSETLHRIFNRPFFPDAHTKLKKAVWLRETTLLVCHRSSLMPHIFTVSTPSPFCLFKSFCIPSELVLLPPTLETSRHHLHGRTVIYTDNSRDMNHYTYQIWLSSNLLVKSSWNERLHALV